MTWVRYSINGLSPSMNVALTYLIEHGGQYSHYDLVRDATDFLGKRHQVTVVDQTLWALIRRGLLVQGPDTGERASRRTARMYVQLTRKGVSEICQYMQNPHPVPAMELWAWQEYERGEGEA